MIISIHQPQYFPWLGYFEKIARSDVFVLLDDVQFKKNEWQNRNKIRTAQGTQWLTVPVIHNFGQKINEVMTDKNANWERKHLSSIEMNYGKAPYFKIYHDLLKEAYSQKWEKLSEVNIFFIEKFIEIMGIKIKTVRSSEMKTEGEKTDRLISICRALNADTYLSGAGAKDYIEEDKFKNNNIGLEFQDFCHPVYKQLYGEFIPGMSVIDLILNCGPQSLDILKNKNSQ